MVNDANEMEVLSELNQLMKSKIDIQNEIADFEQKIEEIAAKLKDNKDKLIEIEVKINNSLSLLTQKTPKKTLKKPPYHTTEGGITIVSEPEEGIVRDMIDAMTINNPMSVEEIITSLDNKYKINSVRSYLANLDYFRNVKKKDQDFNNFGKKGWIVDVKYAPSKLFDKGQEHTPKEQ